MWTGGLPDLILPITAKLLHPPTTGHESHPADTEREDHRQREGNKKAEVGVKAIKCGISSVWRASAHRKGLWPLLISKASYEVTSQINAECK